MIDEKEIKIMVELIDDKLKGYTGSEEKTLRIVKRSLEYVLQRNDNPFINTMR